MFMFLSGPRQSEMLRPCTQRHRNSKNPRPAIQTFLALSGSTKENSARPPPATSATAPLLEPATVIQAPAKGQEGSWFKAVGLLISS